MSHQTPPSYLLTPPDSTPPTPKSARFLKPKQPSSFAYLNPSAIPPVARSNQNDTASSSTVVARRSYRNSLLALTDVITSTVTGTISSLSFPPVIAAARYAIFAMLSQSITYGRLRIISSEGSHTFPERKAGENVDADGDEATATIRVLRDTFWLRLVTQGDLGFSEAYMEGDCEVSDLVAVFQIFIRSRPSLDTTISPVQTIPSRIFSVVTGITNSRFANTIANSLTNIRAHYDLSNAMFAQFLSADMTYSCGIFPELDADLRLSPSDEARMSSQIKGIVGDVINDTAKRVNGYSSSSDTDGEGSTTVEGEGEIDELEEAQLAKLRHIIKKADIKSGHRVLEIGSGWGSLAIEAVRTTGCTVDTITLSSQQKALVEERIKAAGMAGRIRVWLMDYRNLPEGWKGRFDRVVSIEMLEAVGKDFIPGYFSVIDWALNAEGAACIQVITIPEARFETYQREVDFIRKWIFPGGFLPSVSFVTDAILKGGKGRLVMESLSNIGPHYARTLREWQKRFIDNFHVIGPAMMAEHPEMTEEDVEVFRRKWIYYFCYCEVGFSERVIGDHIFTLVREGNAEYECQVFE